MNFNSRAICLAVWLITASLSADITKIDVTNEVINQFKRPFANDDCGGFDELLRSKSGAIAWKEEDSDRVYHYFYWDPESGVIKISDDPDFLIATKCKTTYLKLMFFDDKDNLFFHICDRSFENNKQYPLNCTNKYKYFVWNKNSGYMHLGIEGFSHIWNLSIAGGKLIATGFDDELGSPVMSVITPTNGVWPWESAEPNPVAEPLKH